MGQLVGKTDHVVVVGAGLAGLAAALHLAGRGRAVTVVERAEHPGGRMGRLDVGGYRIDTGPTVLTMPEIIDDTLAAVGESLADRLDLIEVDPAYRASFADGSQIHVHRDAEAMADEVARVAGADEAEGYLRLRDWLTELYRVEFDGFIAANFDSPLSLLTPQLARLAAIGGFRRWDRVMRRFITDERLRRIFTFQALYAGVPPQRALAVYAVIAYMDTVAGVYFPRGGMRAVPDALAAAAVTAGVEFRYGAAVSGLRQAQWSGHRRVHRRRRTHRLRRRRADHRACRHLPVPGPPAAPPASASARTVSGGGAPGLPRDHPRPRITPSSSARPGIRRSATSSTKGV